MPREGLDQIVFPARPIRQREGDYCGAACIQILLSALGPGAADGAGAGTQAEILERTREWSTPAERHWPSSPTGLSKALRVYLPGHKYRRIQEDTKRPFFDGIYGPLKLGPVMVLVNTNHWVVLNGGLWREGAAAPSSLSIRNPNANYWRSGDHEEFTNDDEGADGWIRTRAFEASVRDSVNPPYEGQLIAFVPAWKTPFVRATRRDVQARDREAPLTLGESLEFAWDMVADLGLERPEPELALELEVREDDGLTPAHLAVWRLPENRGQRLIALTDPREHELVQSLQPVLKKGQLGVTGMRAAARHLARAAGIENAKPLGPVWDPYIDRAAVMALYFRFITRDQVTYYVSADEDVAPIRVKTAAATA